MLDFLPIVRLSVSERYAAIINEMRTTNTKYEISSCLITDDIE